MYWLYLIILLLNYYFSPPCFRYFSFSGFFFHDELCGIFQKACIFLLLKSKLSVYQQMQSKDNEALAWVNRKEIHKCCWLSVPTFVFWTYRSGFLFNLQHQKILSSTMKYNIKTNTCCQKYWILYYNNFSMVAFKSYVMIPNPMYLYPLIFVMTQKYPNYSPW